MTTRNRGRSAMSHRGSFGGQELDIINRYGRGNNKPQLGQRQNTYSANGTYGNNSRRPSTGSNYNAYSGGGGGRGGRGGRGNFQRKFSAASSGISPALSPSGGRRGGYNAYNGGGSGGGGGGHHQRRGSNLLQPGVNDEVWNQSHVRNESQDMAQAMASMVGAEANKIYKNVNFLDELQMLADSDEHFCRLSNADDWSYKEVCYWMSTINLEKYVPNFESQIIDGSILLRDLDENMLLNELGVKRLHVKKMLREMKKLRDLSPKFKKPSENCRDALIESLRMEMNVIKRENNHLKLQVERYKQQQTSSIFATLSRRGSAAIDRARVTGNTNNNNTTSGNHTNNNNGKRGNNNTTTSTASASASGTKDRSQTKYNGGYRK